MAKLLHQLRRDERLYEGDGLHEVDDVLTERGVLAQDGRVVEDLGPDGCAGVAAKREVLEGVEGAHEADGGLLEDGDEA